MRISSLSTASTAVGSAADRATDAALAKATATLTADRKAGAERSQLHADQKAIAKTAKTAKAAQKADEVATAAPMGAAPKSSGVDITA